MKKLLYLGMALVAFSGAEARAEEFEFRFEPATFQEQDFTGGGPSNQFPRAKGVYNGLITPTNDFVAEQSGYFRFWIDLDRDFTGWLDMGEDSIWLRGHFNRQGQAGVLVYRRDWDDCFCFFRLRLVWHVRLQLVADSDEIQGTIENVPRGWISDLFGYRGYGSVDGPAPETGRYTLRLPGNADPAIAPAGEGYGMVKVTSRGSVQVSGALADSMPFSRSAIISTNGWWPFFLPLNSGRGALIGWLNFNSSERSDVSGDLLWVKPRSDGRQFYPDGYTGTVAASGSRYFPPAGGGALLSWTDGVCRLSGGNLSAPVANSVTLLPSGALTDNGGGLSGLTFRLSRSSGVFRGKFIHPDTSRRTSFAGILDQLADIGAGFFLGTDQGGLVRLEAAP